jgi:tetratricopeptide (TPR) repeat protein
LGDYGSAEKGLKAYLGKRADDYVAWYNLGLTYGNKAQYEDAILAYKKALEVKPDYVEAWNNLGVAYGKQGQYDDAISAYKKALEIKPDYAEAWNNLGVTYGKQDRNDDEITAYKKALEIKPDYAVAWNNLCLSYLGLFTSTGVSGPEEASVADLRAALFCWEHLEEQGPIMETLGRAFKHLLKKKKLDALRAAYHEIESAGPQELRDFLSPYGVMLQYLATSDHGIIDRLRPEERTIIEEMLKVAEAKPRHDKKTGPTSKSRKRR